MVKKLTPPTVALFGGKYLARGGETVTLEGQWNPQRLVIMEFKSMDQAKAWWNSDEYAPVNKCVRNLPLQIWFLLKAT